MRIAAIDIGTNSIHMIVVDVGPDLSFEVVDREKDMVRLGAGGLDGRNLSDAAMEMARQTLSKYCRLAESHRVDEIVACATSAVREAVNGGDFIAGVQRDLGIRVRVISGTEEGRLIHLAAAYGVDIGSGTAVVVDVGGGSVEITYGSSARAQLARSFKIGVIRLTERFPSGCSCALFLKGRRTAMNQIPALKKRNGRCAFGSPCCPGWTPSTTRGRTPRKNASPGIPIPRA